VPEKLPETIVFDLDGTLIDTAPDLAAALNAVLIEERLPEVSLDEVRHMVGRGARILIERAMAAHGVALTDRRAEALVQHFLVHYEANIAATSRPFDGCITQVRALADKGHRIGICTNKPVALSRKLLTELDLTSLFPVVLGADSRAYHKPDPRHLVDTVAELGGNPADAVMVGDSETDSLTARAAGIPCILVTFGYTEKPIRDLGATALIDHYRDLPAALARCARV
jgi:phosphoglycolate phosphatase